MLSLAEAKAIAEEEKQKVYKEQMEVFYKALGEAMIDRYIVEAIKNGKDCCLLPRSLADTINSLKAVPDEIQQYFNDLGYGVRMKYMDIYLCF